MPLIEQSLRPEHPKLDQDGDIIMTNFTDSSIGPFKEKFNFDWFSFNNDSKCSQTKSQSPLSPLSSTSEPQSSLDSSNHCDTSFLLDPSPISPDLPLKTLTHGQPQASQIAYPPPPTKPLAWVWQCHMCRSRYPLSITRRCLIDGHYYCSGDSTTQRNTKRRRKAQSCTSEFDYVGWQEWGQWRRKCMALQSLANGSTSAPVLHGCESCSFPSQCRYENRPKAEVVHLEKYISKDDLTRMESELNSNGVDETMDPEVEVPTPEPHSTKAATKENKLGTGNRDRKKLQKKVVRLDKISTSSTVSENTSIRQRFYSSLTINPNVSSPEPSPTSGRNNSFDAGKFDPTLPSLTNSSTNTISTDLSTIESTLKQALATQSSLTSTKRTKTNPSPNLADLTTNGTDNTNPLTRTTSHQNLFPDFACVSKTTNDSTSNPKPNTNTRGAVSEAEITSFLQLRTTSIDTPPLSSSVSRRDFEEIALSPPSSRERDATTSVFKEHFPGREEGEQRSVAVAGGSGSGSGGVGGERMSFFGLAGLGFGFGGRKEGGGK